MCSIEITIEMATMFKSVFKTFGAALSLLSIGSMASAGSLAEGMADPVVENLVIEEGDDSSIGLLPIVGLLVIAAIIASNGDDGSSKKSGPTKSD